MENLKLKITNMKTKNGRSESSINAYVRNIDKLSRMLEVEVDDKLTFLSNFNGIKEKLSILHFTTQRNYYNAIIVALQAIEGNEKLIEEYQEIRNKLNKQYEDENATSVISAKQKDAFVEMSTIEDMLSKMKKELMADGLTTKTEMNKKQRNLFQMYVMISVLTKYPMRNDLGDGTSAINKKEYNALTDADKKDNNYLVIGKNTLFFCLNDYKTKKKYLEKCINVEDPALKRLLRQYVRFNGYGVLFKNSLGEPMNRNQITKALTNTFENRIGKKISTTMLRKIYLSSKYGKCLEDMKKDAYVMGHDIQVAQSVYIKQNEASVDPVKMD